MSPVVILLAVQLQVLSPGQSVSIALLQVRSLHRQFHKHFSGQDCSANSVQCLQVPTNATHPFTLMLVSTEELITQYLLQDT